MSLKWHGCFYVPKDIKGGGPQGATLGLLEYMSQSHNSADSVGVVDMFKFVDDLTILEIVNLLSVGITSSSKFHLTSQLTTSSSLQKIQNLIFGLMKLNNGLKTKR